MGLYFLVGIENSGYVVVIFVVVEVIILFLILGNIGKVIYEIDYRFLTR